MSTPNHPNSFANPSPAALAALAMACFTFFAMYNNLVSSDAGPILACWMIGGGLIQYAAGVMELKNGDPRGGNVFLTFGAFFMISTALSLLVKYMLTQNGLPFDSRVEGWAWLAVTIPIILWSPAYLKKCSRIMFFMVILIDCALLLISFMDMQVLVRTPFAPIAGWMLFLVGILGIYLAGATVVNDVFGRTVMPIPGPMLKEREQAA